MKYNPDNRLPCGSISTPMNSLHYPHRTEEAEKRYAAKIAARKNNGRARNDQEKPCQN